MILELKILYSLQIYNISTFYVNNLRIKCQLLNYLFILKTYLLPVKVALNNLKDLFYDGIFGNLCIETKPLIYPNWKASLLYLQDYQGNRQQM